VKYCQQVLHCWPVLHGRLQVNWSAKVGALMSYFPRKWATLAQQDLPDLAYRDLFDLGQPGLSCASYKHGVPIIGTSNLLTDQLLAV